MGVPSAAGPEAASSHRWSRAASVYVIGETTSETGCPEKEEAELARFCRRLGASIARAGADLVVCSPCPDSADFHTALGYARSGAGHRVNLHRPRDADVARQEAELRGILGPASARLLRTWHYPGPDGADRASLQQAWLLCRLMALDHADAVISIGGRTATSADALLHLAEARGVPVVPFAFLGGASRRAYRRSRWRHQAGLDFDRLRSKESVDDAMAIADLLLTARLKRVRAYAEPPQRIFISRARADAAYAAAASRHLTRAGFEVLMGDKDPVDNRVIESAIEEAVLRADLVIALWSRSFAASRFCFDELDLALRRHRAGDLHLWIINLDGSDVVPPGARTLPQALARSPNALVTLLDDLLGPAAAAYAPAARTP